MKITESHQFVIIVIWMTIGNACSVAVSVMRCLENVQIQIVTRWIFRRCGVIDIICEIIIWISIALVFSFVVWALFGIAKLSDEMSDEQWEQYMKEHGDKEDSL